MPSGSGDNQALRSSSDKVGAWLSHFRFMYPTEKMNDIQMNK